MDVRNFLVVAVSGMLAMGCATLEQQDYSADRELYEMSRLYEDLVPYMFNQETFQDPKNQPYIKTKMNEVNYRLASLRHGLEGSLHRADPAILSGIEKMKNSLQESQDSFYVQSYSYSQKQLKDSLKHFIKLTMFIVNDASRVAKNSEKVIKADKNVANFMELANLQIASQEYPRALRTLSDYVLSPDADKERQQKALELMMVVSVQNMQSIPVAKQTVAGLLENPSMQNHRNMLQKWDQYLTQAMKKSRQEILSNSLEVPYLASRNYVENLHKSTLLHDALKKESDRKSKAKILFALGKYYSQNRDLGFGNLPQRYFEGCINEFPHSKLSERCYFSLEEEIRNKHRLSISDQLPKTEKQKLVRLKYLTRVYYTKRAGSISNVLEY